MSGAGGTAVSTPGSRVVVALDVSSAAEAETLIGRLGLARGGPAVKVGMELYYAAGPAVLDVLAASGLPVFCDLKLHDIPNTAGRGARLLAERGAWMLNAHAAGGRAMLEAVVAGARAGAAALGRPAPRVLAVTVLTSLDGRALRDEVGLAEDPEAAAVRWARLAQVAGCDGVVCSPREAAAVKAACGPGFLAVTPGVRPAWAQGTRLGGSADDQRRTATPGEAVAAGADYVVVGRPVTGAADPAAALARVVAEVEAAATRSSGYPGRAGGYPAGGATAP